MISIFGPIVRFLSPPRFFVDIFDDDDGDWCWVSDRSIPSKGGNGFHTVHCCSNSAQAVLVAHELNQRHPHRGVCVACPKCWHSYRTNCCDKVCHCAAYRIAATIPGHHPTIYDFMEGRTEVIH